MWSIDVLLMYSPMSITSISLLSHALCWLAVWVAYGIIFGILMNFGLAKFNFWPPHEKKQKKTKLRKILGLQTLENQRYFNFAMFLALGSHFVIMCFCMCLSFLFCGDILLSFGFVFYCHFGLENDNEMQNQMTTKWQRKTEMTTHAKPNDKNMPEKRQKYIFNNPQSLLVRFS